MRQFSYIIFSMMLLVSCGKTPKEQAKNIINSDSIKVVKDTLRDVPNEIDYSVASTDTVAAQKIRLFLLTELQSDLPNLTKNDRKFSFYGIDLNDDNKNEYLVSLTGGYFCGTGGCTFYLLNDTFKLINIFTVTNPPIFRSSEKTNGWNNLILLGEPKSENEQKYKHLKWGNGKYPSNPSLIKDKGIAPTGHDFVMWHDEFSRAKPFDF